MVTWSLCIPGGRVHRQIMKMLLSKQIQQDGFIRKTDDRPRAAACPEEGKNSVLQSRIDFLERQLEMQLAQIEQLSAKQESAYQKVQDIAGRAGDFDRREQVSFTPSGTCRSTAEQ